MVGEGIMRTTAEVLEDQARQADAERRERARSAAAPATGLSPLHALQERLWHWHDMRRRSKAARCRYHDARRTTTHFPYRPYTMSSRTPLESASCCVVRHGLISPLLAAMLAL